MDFNIDVGKLENQKERHATLKSLQNKTLVQLVVVVYSEI